MATILLSPQPARRETPSGKEHSMRTVLIAVTLAVAGSLTQTGAVEAGCGCNKPPPPSASIRPAFASPGNTVTLFSAQFVPGTKYTVQFVGMTTTMQTSAIAVMKRDL